MQKTDRPIKEFLASLPEESRADMQALDELISTAIPQASKVMWEGVFWGGSEQKIIGYGDVTYVGSNKKPVEWFAVGLALQKNYITVYATGVEDGKYLAEEYKPVLGKAKVGRSSVSFKSIADINTEKLAELVSRCYKVQVDDL